MKHTISCLTISCSANNNINNYYHKNLMTRGEGWVVLAIIKFKVSVLRNQTEFEIMLGTINQLM